MKERKIVAKNGENERAGKATYSPPRLIEFGPVGALTQSGTGSMVESQQMMGSVIVCQPNSMRSMC
jgi:hypothetical protein